MRSIENICRAYSVRNPTIGYCQGFNFIIGRLVRIMSEEVSIREALTQTGSFLDLLLDNRVHDAT